MKLMYGFRNATRINTIITNLYRFRPKACIKFIFFLLRIIN